LTKNALSWLGCNEHFVRSLALFAVPRKFSHSNKVAAGALGRLNLGGFLGFFAVECKLLELWEVQVVEVVVPSHELGLIIHGSKLDALSFLKGR
jgi:hypothetical protein